MSDIHCRSIDQNEYARENNIDMVKRKQVKNEDDARVFDVIVPEDVSAAEIQIKTGKGRQAYKTIGVDTALQQIFEAISVNTL